MWVSSVEANREREWAFPFRIKNILSVLDNLTQDDQIVGILELRNRTTHKIKICIKTLGPSKNCKLTMQNTSNRFISRGGGGD